MRALLALLALLSLSLPAAAQDSALTSMQTMNDARGWAAVGRLNMNGVGFCTATLISETRVLTAAHCLFNRDTGARLDNGQLEFLAGWRNGRAEATRGVARSVIWPDFDMAAGADSANVPSDIALLELDRPVRLTSVRPFDVARIPPLSGSAVAVVSYAQDRAEAPSIQETCHVLEQRADGLMVMSCDIDYGSSGAPVFQLDGRGDVHIVSVISARADGDGRAFSLGMHLPARVEAMAAALDADRVQGVATVRGARESARFVRP